MVMRSFPSVDRPLNSVYILSVIEASAVDFPSARAGGTAMDDEASVAVIAEDASDAKKLRRVGLLASNSASSTVLEASCNSEQQLGASSWR